MNRMRFFVFFLISIVFIGCGGSGTCYRPPKEWLMPNGRVKILATTAMIGDLAKKIGGEDADVHVLIQGSLDPHSYQIVKGDEELLTFSDLVISNGLNLEHGPGLQKRLKDHPHSLPLGDEIMKRKKDSIIFVQGLPDPHIWMDPGLWKENVNLITEALIVFRPEKASLFQARSKQLQEELSRLDEQVRSLLHSIPDSKRYLVTSHDAFNYFARAYLSTSDERSKNEWQQRFQAPEGLSPESQLSSGDIQGIIDHLAKYQIQVVFPESNVSEDSIRKIMRAGREKGISIKIASKPLYADAMGCPGSGAETYETMLLYDAKTIAEHLKEGN